MSEQKIKVKEIKKEYELPKEDQYPNTGDEAPTWYNKTAGILDKFRLIPRLIMLAYIHAFISPITWFMTLAEPTKCSAMFISTIVGVRAAFLIVCW